MGYIQLQLYSLKDGSIVCVWCAIARGNNTLSFVMFYKETTKTIDVEKGAGYVTEQWKERSFVSLSSLQREVGIILNA